MKIFTINYSEYGQGNSEIEPVRHFKEKSRIFKQHKGIPEKWVILIIFLLALASNVFSQDYDLIVTDKNDSIACYIDSISENTIYFKMRYNKKWIHTQYDRNQVIDYRLLSVNKKDVTFKHGTSYIISPDFLPINQSNRNIAYANGSFSVSHYTYTLNYERILSISQNAKKTWSIRIGYGIIDSHGKIALATFNNLTGKGKNKFEMNIGATYINEPHSYGPHYFTIVLNAGYRRQSPDKRFVFRTGIGTPEGPYLSLGYAF